MDVQSISTALAAALSEFRLHVYDYGPDAPLSPAAYIYPEPVTYHADFDEDVTPTFIVRFLISSVVTKGGQEQLNALISTGPGSAVTAIEADGTLGGVVSSVQVLGMREYGVVQLPDAATRYYSAELVVEVLA